MQESFDILIKEGLIFDGTGREPIEADIGIVEDKIVYVSTKTEDRRQKAEKIIYAEGLVVAPGFIDTHGHSEFTLLADSRAEGKISQGITTEINGNCGLSAAPLQGEALKQREGDLEELDIQERWSTFQEYFEILERKGIAINFATLAGHGNIRASVSGYADKTPDNIELKRMQTLLWEAIHEGAIGLSTGLIYPPGVYSKTEELINLLHHSSFILHPSIIYTSHMRSEGDRLIESIQELIRIGSEANIKVHISHIKTSGKENWYKIDEAISLMEDARKQGINITCDRYPYTAASTDLDSVLPSWTYEGGSERELERLKSSRVQEMLKKEILYKHPDMEYWEGVRVSAVSTQKNKWMEGKSIAYIARHEGAGLVDMLLKILVEEKLRVGAIFSSMNEDNLRRFLLLPYVMIGTDSSARSTDGTTHKGKPHPRGFGSFPRFLGRYVRDEGLMSLGEAIHKITMLPAKTFDIHERGIIKKGAFADIVVFDPDKIIDRATFDEPFLKPEGVYYVIVNGKPAVWEGEMTGIRAGRVLKNGK